MVGRSGGVVLKELGVLDYHNASAASDSERDVVQHRSRLCQEVHTFTTPRV